MSKNWLTSSSKKSRKDINSIYTHSQKGRTIQNKNNKKEIDTKINKESQKDITMMSQSTNKTRRKIIALKMNNIENINKIK